MKKLRRATEQGADHNAGSVDGIVPSPRPCYPLTDAHGQTTAYICADPAELIRVPAEAQA